MGDALRTSLGYTFISEVVDASTVQNSRSIDEEYEMDWSKNRELRVELIGASNLSEPEYRLGDLTSGLLFGGADARFANVYVHARLDDVCKQSAVARGDAQN